MTIIPINKYDKVTVQGKRAETTLSTAFQLATSNARAENPVTKILTLKELERELERLQTTGGTAHDTGLIQGAVNKIKGVSVLAQS